MATEGDPAGFVESYYDALRAGDPIAPFDTTGAGSSSRCT